MDADFITLEVSPDDANTLASVFRTIHTIKGTCGFFGFTKLESLTHAGENMLVTMRDDGLAMQEDIADALLAMVYLNNELRCSISTFREPAGRQGQTEPVERWNRILCRLGHARPCG